MRYFDTGGRNPEHSLARWLEEKMRGEVKELRIQTGFFSLEGTGFLIPALERCRANDWTTKILIGSNDSITLRDDVSGLIEIMGLPRDSAKLGIVCFRGAYFHPKTFHITRADGSQAAFVGSANLTAAGLMLHVEAGIALDTDEGDDPNLLLEIASAIDSWFDEQREGLNVVTGLAMLDVLVESGVLTLVPAPRAIITVPNLNRAGVSVIPRLSPLVQLPRVRTAATKVGHPTLIQPTTSQSVVGASVAVLPSAPREGFPPYFLFEQNSVGSTFGISALSGILLPGGAAGLIVQLNRDSARHFEGRGGTANISIPVETVTSIRFGVFGMHDRPRAEFLLKLRYWSDSNIIDGGTLETNVMGYGFTKNETGHSDVRFLVPKGVLVLNGVVSDAELPTPKVGDLVLLEWPTSLDPSFKLSLIDTKSSGFQQVSTLYDAAVSAGQVVGNGACWLPAGLSPNWY